MIKPTSKNSDAPSGAEWPALGGSRPAASLGEVSKWLMVLSLFVTQGFGHGLDDEYHNYDNRMLRAR